MDIELSPEEVHTFKEALLAAFTKRSDLEEVVYEGLGRKLDRIVEPGDLSAQVYELVIWVNSQNMIGRLLICARQKNPGNAKLREFETYLQQIGKIAAGISIQPPGSKSIVARTAPRTETIVLSSETQRITPPPVGDEQGFSTRLNSDRIAENFKNAQRDLEAAIAGYLFCLERTTYLYVFETHLLVIRSSPEQVGEVDFWKHGRDLVQKLDAKENLIPPPKHGAKLKKFITDLKAAQKNYNALFIASQKTGANGPSGEDYANAVIDFCQCILDLQPRAAELKEAYHEEAGRILSVIVEEANRIVGAMTVAEQNAEIWRIRAEDAASQRGIAWATSGASQRTDLDYKSNRLPRKPLSRGPMPSDDAK